MSNTFGIEDAYGNQQGQPQQEPRSDKEFSMRDAYGPDPTALRANTLAVRGRDPALVAESERLAKKYGLPTDVAERQIDTLRTQQDIEGADTLAREAPMVAGMFANDPSLYAMAKEDRQPLTLLEQIMQRGADTFVRAPASGVVQGAGSALSGAGEALNMAGRGQQRVQEAGAALWGLFGEDMSQQYLDNLAAMRAMLPGVVQNPLGTLGGALRGAGSSVEEFAQDIGVPEERQNLATDIGSGIGSLVPYVAATLATGGAGALALGATQGIDTQADRAEDAGTYGTASADLGQTIGATVTAVTERFGIERLLSRLPEGVKQNLQKRVADILLAGATEGAQEITESVVQDAVTKVLVDETFSPFQGLEREGLVGFAVGALFRGGVHVYRQQYDADLATQEAATLDQIEQLVGQTNLSALSPERMREVLGRLKGSMVSDVYLPVDKFRTLFQSDQDLDAAIPELGIDRAEYTSALLSNGQVRIPVENYLTAMTPEQRSEAKKHARLTSQGMTPEEALRFNPEEALREFLDATGAETRDANDPSLWVQDQVRAQAESAGMSPATAETTAILYGAAARTMASRYGLTVEDLFGTPEAPRIDIRREMPEVVRRAMERRDTDVIVDSAIDALRSGRLFTDREVQGGRLTEVIRRAGGIDPSAFGAGDLRAQDAQRFGLLRRGGMTLDEALTLAREDGFIFNTATENAGEFDAAGADINTLVDMLTGDLSGVSPAFASGNFNIDRARFNEAANELARMLDEIGIGREQLGEMDNAAVRRALGMDGQQAEGGVTFDQAAPIGSQAFRDWFQQSKVTKPDGTPMVVYHGTGEEFAAFDKARLSQGTGHSSSGLGFYFTPSRRSAEGYAEKASNGVPADAVVLEVYLSIQNPYTMTLDEAQSFEDAAESAAVRWMLQQQGFDGVWIPEQNAWVAFEPTQVKSIHNRGTWSRNDPRMLFQSVFHGSPHRGIEQTGFSLQKIGTGEGAQAYGWGLYFASRKEVAEAYREALSATDRIYTVDGEPVSKDGTDPLLWMAIDALARPDIYKPDTLADRLRDQGAVESNVEIIERHLEELRGRVDYREVTKGQLYAAEIPDDSDLLDWDAPLSEQPEKIKAAIGKLGFSVEKNPDPVGRSEAWLVMFNGNSLDAFATKKEATAALNAMTGRELYTKMSTSRGQRGTSEFLLSLGIPGLRYLDGTSRGAGDGSRNYVIWDEGAISDVRTFYQSQPAEQTQTPEFKRWSEGAPLVQRQEADRHAYKTGEPFVVRALHGTPDGRFMQTDGIFKGQREKFGMQSDGSDRAFWFSTSDATAKTYADPTRAFDYQNAEPAIIDGFVKMLNPLVIDGGGQDWRSAQQRGRSSDVIRQAREGGHDGVVITNVRDDYNNTKRTKPTTTFVVFSSNQIKSATNNDGSFDLGDPSTLSQSLDGSGKRGSIQITPQQSGMDRFIITLGSKADKSTLLHEGAHAFLEMHKQGDAYLRGLDPETLTPTQRQQVKDNEKLLDWLGVDSFDAIGVEQHEKFAETWEAYLREGNAPSTALRRHFQQFRAWLVQIYRSLRNLPRADLTPEVRQFFDRMLATDQEIEAAREDLSLRPVITPEMRGDMTDEEYERYVMAVDQARQAALDSEAAIQFTYAKREAEAARSREMREIEEQVASEMNGDPVWRAISMFRTGKQPDGTELPAGERPIKLDTQAVTDMMGKEWVKKNLVLMHRREGGVHPEMAASLFGFASATDMLQQISSRPSRRDAIKAEALRRWNERNPDPMLDGSLNERAVKAAHNDAQARVFVREINALSRGNKMLLEPLKAYVERTVGKMQVRNLNPQRHLATEMREGRKALAAAAKGDREATLAARRAQLMAHLMYRAETDAKERAEAFREKGLALSKKAAQERFAKAGWENYLDKINQILAAFDLRRMSNKDLERKKSLRAWVEAQQEAGEITAVSEELMARVESERVANWRESSVADIDAAMDAIKNIEHLARLKNKLTAARNEAEWQDAKGELLDRMKESLPDIVGGEVSSRDVDTRERAQRAVGGALANLNRPENVIEALDGGETGPWHDYFWTVLQDAENKAVGYRRDLGAKLKELRGTHGAVFDSFQDKVAVLNGKLTVSRATLIGIALNTGNATNMQRLRDGGIAHGETRVRLGDAEIRQLMSELRADELAFVQGMWDTVNSLWPDIVNLQRRMSGLPPEKVEPREISVVSKDGKSVTLAGGYWPLVYDSSRTETGEQQEASDALRTMMGAGFTRAFTPKGYQKSRVENFEAPLHLDFAAVMSRHMDHVITDLSHREAVRDINRILTDNEIKEQVILRVGRDGYDNLRGALSYAVSASSAVAGRVARWWVRPLDAVLTNMSVSALAIRPDIALGNLTSATIQGLDRVGVKALMRGWWALETSRSKTTEAIVAKSAFMAQRLGDTDFFFQQELARLDGRRGWGPAYRRIMMAMHRAADAEVTRALWWGRYQKELDAGQTEAQAVILADKAVRQTQTASGRKDISTFERDSQFKQARQFMGPMFVIFGRLYAAARGEGASQKVGARVATLMVQVFMAPAIFALAAGRWAEDTDDEEGIGPGDWARWLAVNVGMFPIMTLPFIRDIGAIAEAAIYDTQPNPRANPTTQAVIQMGRAFNSLGNNIETYGETGEVDYYDATRDIAAIMGPIVGAPASQVRITTKSIEAYLADDDKSNAELARMAVYGPPRETQ